MSGHSKWSKIQHKKGKNDKARSSAFTKLLRAIVIAASQGGSDPDMNFSLRLAIQKAKAGNVPKDNIERAIKRGSGEGKDAAQFEEAIYEGFGPAGVAVIVETLTDNKNRTVSEVKHTFSKYGGSMGAIGSVQWQFERKGLILLTNEQKNALGDWDEQQLELMDKGIDDIEESPEGVQLLMPMEQLKEALDFLKEKNVEPEESGLEWIAKEAMELDETGHEKLQKLLDVLDESDDVKDVYTNAK